MNILKGPRIEGSTKKKYSRYCKTAWWKCSNWEFMLPQKVLKESLQKQNVLKQKSFFKCRKAFLNRVKTENAKSCLVKINNFKRLCPVTLFLSHSQNSIDAKTSADSFKKSPRDLACRIFFSFYRLIIYSGAQKKIKMTRFMK